MTDGVTILGAGVAGLCVAHELSRRGARVALVDPHPAPGPHHCSWWAGGMLAPFCEGETAEEPVTRLGQEAAGWWRRAGAEVTEAGSLVVALGRDRAELDRFARRTRAHRWLDAEALAEIEPDLAARFDRALFFPQEAHLAPREALEVLRAGLERRGVTVRDEAPEQGRMIDCRGLSARRDLPGLRGVRGEMVLLHSDELTLSRPVRLLHPRHPLYIVPRGGGRYMIGATQIESDDRGPGRLRSVVELLNAAYALHPALGEAQVLEIGADARPAFADNLPRILQAPDRLHVNGLFRHGFLLAPALARMTADLVLNGTTPEITR